MLSLLLLIPILGSITLLFVEDTPSGEKSKKIALATSMINLAISIYLWIQFDSSTSQYQFVYNFKELSFCHLNIGVDSLSIYFVLLTTFITPIALLSNYNNIKNNLKYFLISFLLLETLQIALFVVLDLLLFYVFFESVLPVLFIVIILYGSGEAKIRSALLFFLYTLAGSLFMLLAILEISNYVGSTDFQLISLSEINLESQKYLWLAFFLAFAIKTPLWPMTGWLYRAHADSPLAGSIILAAILLKLSTYGILRVLLNFLPDATLYFTPLVQTIAIITLIFASLATIVQQDTKALIAYSSIAHMAVVTLGLFSNTVQGIEGAILLAIAHGFVSPALFICVGGVIYDRTGVRLIPYIRGLVLYMPVFTILFFIFTLCNTGIPLSLNFLGEQLCLIGIWELSPLVSVLGATGIVFSAIYSIWLYNRLSYGSYSPYLKPLKDITRREFLLLFSLLIPTILLGVYPNVILNTLHASVTTLLYNVPSIPFLDSQIFTISLIGINKKILKFKLNNLNLIDLNYVNLVRSFHYGSILQAGIEHTNIKEKKASINQKTQVTCVALTETENIVCEQGLISSFAEAFPNYNNFLHGSQSNNPMQETLIKISSESPTSELTANSTIICDCFIPIFEQLRDFDFTKLLSLDKTFYLGSIQNINLNIEIDKFQDFIIKLDKILRTLTQDVAEEQISQVTPSTVLNFISYVDDKIIINFNPALQLFERFLELVRKYYECYDTIVIGLLILVLIFFVNFIFNKVVKIETGKALPNISHLPQNPPVKLFNNEARQRSIFKGVENKLNKTVKFLVNLIKPNNPNSPNFYFVITTIFLFWLNFFYHVNPVLLLLIVVILCCFLLLYLLLSVYILVKYSIPQKDNLIIPQLVPNKIRNRIRNYLLELKEINKNKTTNIVVYIELFPAIFLLIFIIFNLIFITIIFIYL